MENAKRKIPANIEMAVIVANFMKEKMEQEIKEELSSVGKEDIWEKIEKYADLTTAANFYELIKK